MEGRHAMGDDDDTPGAGSSLPENLFAAAREAQEQEAREEARPTGPAPIGLGNTNAAEAEPGSTDPGSLLRFFFDDAEQLSRIARRNGLRWVMDRLAAEHGHREVSAAAKGDGRRHPLTTAQVWYRAGIVEALRREGCTELTDIAKIVADAHGEGNNHESVRKALGDACRRAAKLGIADRLARWPDEDLRSLADRLHAAARPGGKKLPKFLAARRK
jgi:hypothetical protein